MGKSHRDQRRRIEKDTKKQKKSHKKHKNKKHKHKSKHLSSSSSRSHSSHTPPSIKQHEAQKQQQQNNILSLQLPQSKPAVIPQEIMPKRKINLNLLTNIISDQKKMNRNLDAEQTRRAATKFKQNFTEQIKPITMSAYLSNQSLQKKLKAKQIFGSMQCSICLATFSEIQELEQHMQRHNQ